MIFDKEKIYNEKNYCKLIKISCKYWDETTSNILVKEIKELLFKIYGNDNICKNTVYHKIKESFTNIIYLTLKNRALNTDGRTIKKFLDESDLSNNHFFNLFE